VHVYKGAHELRKIACSTRK